MNRSDLMEQRTRGLTVGEGIQRGLRVVGNDLDGWFNSVDGRPLRVVTQPGRGTVLRGSPEAAGGEVPRSDVSSWRWYYVFDSEVVDGRTWVLLAETPVVLNGMAFAHTEESGPRDLIRGWAPLDEVTIWATHVALELNTDPEVVARRVRQSDPARVYASRFPQAQPLWEERLDVLWDEGRPRRDLAGVISTDPVGVGPTFPRLAVMQRVDGSLQVAGGGVVGTGSFAVEDRAKSARGVGGGGVSAQGGFGFRGGRDGEHGGRHAGDDGFPPESRRRSSSERSERLAAGGRSSGRENGIVFGGAGCADFGDRVSGREQWPRAGLQRGSQGRTGGSVR